MNDLRSILLSILSAIEHNGHNTQVWLTPDALSKYLGISKNTIYQYVSRGKIPFHKIPNSSKLLFNRKEIDEWILGRKLGPKVSDDVKQTVDRIWPGVKP